jgi:hypothetical protein
MDTEESGVSSDNRELSTDANAESDQKEQAKNAESAAGCCWRCITSIPDTSPRCFSIVFRIIFPLWLLIVLSVVGGIFLSNFEAPNELDTNDLVMANKYTLQVLDLNVTVGLLLKLPEQCFHDYLRTINITGENLTLADVVEKRVDGSA